MDVDLIRGYRRSSAPSIPGAERQYTEQEFQKLENCLNQAIEVIRRLEDRLVAGGL